METFGMNFSNQSDDNITDTNKIYYKEIFEDYIGGIKEQYLKTRIRFLFYNNCIKINWPVYKKDEYAFTLYYDDIISFEYRNESHRSAGKAAAGAVIGGILTGGIGLLFGAALGGRKKRNEDFFLNINYKNQVASIHIGKSKTLINLNGEFESFMKRNENKNSTSNVSPSISDELIKLGELKAKGILSEEEFISLKNKLINKG